MLKPFYSCTMEAGTDEAGRGCLAGPVFAAAVILPRNFKLDLLDDSKKMSEKKRTLARPVIEANAAAWSVAMVDNREIDDINILKSRAFYGRSVVLSEQSP